MPEQARVAAGMPDHRVAVVFGPGPAPVVTEGDAFAPARARERDDQGRRAGRAKAE